MRKSILIWLLLFSTACTVFQKKEEDGNSSDFTIKYEVPINAKTLHIKEGDDKRFLIVTNPESGDTWNISYKQFKIMSAAYKNWRVVENKDPIITKIEDDDEYINITFNYLSDNNKSVLSGVVSINKDFIHSEEDYKKYFYGALAATGTYVVIALIILL